MALHTRKLKESNLVLSNESKPRLKWTPELHQMFVDTVDQLGGAEKATPKSLMKIMGVDGLTLFHLKSHLQKYRLGKSQPSQCCNQNTQEAGIDKKPRGVQTNKALQMHVEVQKKLHQQMEVQRHLQLRMEAQRKYFQTILKKAAETVSQYSSYSIEAEQAKDQLSELLSMVDLVYPASPLSVLTQSEMSPLQREGKRHGSSRESSLASSVSSNTHPIFEADVKPQKRTRRTSIEGIDLNQQLSE